MSIVVRNPSVGVRVFLGGLEGAMPRRHPAETFLMNWTKWDLPEPDPLLLHIIL